MVGDVKDFEMWELGEKLGICGTRSTVNQHCQS